MFVQFDWLDSMLGYSVYCKECAQDRWINDLYTFISSSNLLGKEVYEAKKASFKLTGIIMKKLSENTSWDIIRELTYQRITNTLDYTFVGQMMLEYSEHGTEFIEQVYDLPGLRLLTDLTKKYEKKKEAEMLRKLGY